MNLQRVAEWCEVEPAYYEPGSDSPDGAWKLFDPLNNSSDAFTVLAKLWTIGTFQKLSSGVLLWGKREKGLVGVYAESKTRVTDDATLRKAICEIAEKVSGQ